MSKNKTFYALILNALNKYVNIGVIKAENSEEAHEILEESIHNFDSYFLVDKKELEDLYKKIGEVLNG